MTEENIDLIKRNLILKGMAGAAGLLVAGAAVQQFTKYSIPLPTAESDLDIKSDNPDVPDDPNRHWGFIIDLAKCDGCENLDSPPDDPTGEKPRCSYACRKFHYFLDAERPQYWIRVYKLESTEAREPFNFPKPCQNCQDAPCQRVCPTGATFQRDDGTVLIHHDYCIGCRICMAACPYETRFFWYSEPPELDESAKHIKYSPEFAIPHQRGTVVKCDLCIHNVYNNQLPHCVPACPQGAIYYGDLNEDAVSNGREIIPLHDTLNNRGGYRYKEDEGTEPSVYYLPLFDEVNKLEAKLEVRSENQLLDNNTTTVDVSAKDEKGSPIGSAKIVIEKSTTFGTMVVAEGRTDYNGKFSCSLQKNQSKIHVKLLETEKISRCEVIHHV
ncbi:MAG: 4Fe-4S dicluster domain-containing protein [Candidatus Kariarchaeaceae archaeon]|jgi:molybdopterin-containing oxidoreductase family iron-sulfur binding subunit